MAPQSSLVRKIVAAIAIPAVLVATFIVTVIGITEWRLNRQALLESSRSRAQTLAANSTPSLAFNNPEDGEEILSSVASDPQITHAALFTQDGQPFAAYSSPHAEIPLPEQPAMSDGQAFQNGALVLYQPVRQNELWLGTLFISFDLDPLHARLRAFVFTGITAGVAASLLALGLALYLQGSISRPILHLADVARSVTRAKNYSIRAQDSKENYEEVSLLQQSFNTMLSRIEQQDATLRESELQFRRATSNAPIPIAIHDQTGAILELSLGWTRSSGYALDDIPNLVDWVQERCPEQTAQRLRNTLDNPHPSGDTEDLGEFQVTARDGSTRIWQANSTCIGRFQSGRVTWLLLAIDLTESIQDRNTLQERSRELERSNQELDDFAYIASHDMKEPLRGIHNNALFLHEDYHDQLEDDGKRRLDRMRYLCTRLEQLIDDLLYYSRLGRQDLAIQSVDPNEIVADIADMLESSLESQNATIEVPEPLPPCVCDSVRVKEVFRNLITNALKYNDSDPKRVTVGFHREKDGHRHVYYVQDNGFGISPKFHQDVFRIFKRLNPESDEVRGTGSGLTFVKKIVERHHGAVWLESEIGVGTTFYFTLSRDPSPNPKSSPRNPSANAPSSQATT